jgi:hypothetical protein
MNILVVSLLSALLLTGSVNAARAPDPEACKYVASVYAQAKMFKDEGASIEDTKTALRNYLAMFGITEPKAVKWHMSIIDEVYAYKGKLTPEAMYNEVFNSCMSTKV